VRLLLDTVAFLWAVNSPERISAKAMSALRDSGALRELSAISLSEIAIKEARGKISFGKENLLMGISDLKVRVLPYTSDHACHLFGLQLHHADPFDRQIIAQALSEGVPILTPDEKFRLYKGLVVIW
jgi:PIN domain nuclease of toxin-antitoxin system